MDGKRWYLSKTIWVNVLMGLGAILGAFVPSVGSFITEHFSATGSAWMIVNVALRFVTKEEIS